MEKSLKFVPNCLPKSTSQQKLEELEEEEITDSNLNQVLLKLLQLKLNKFCDKVIDVFFNEKPQTKDWRKLLVFREEWRKYSEKFYKRKLKKIDDEIERHSELLKEIEQSPTDINAVVAKRRKDFNEEFFRHLTLLSEAYDIAWITVMIKRLGKEKELDSSLILLINSTCGAAEISRLGTRCLSAICAYGNNAVENAETLDAAQAIFDDILHH
ncbi:hypothetical protein C5167_007955 [Papaver somniferum]|uniref:Uncharacterized protein n=1 Tax=Papaver somniferum TaxID=3469 RepID=A0A4Y7JT34_PAPSO|nr:hypothetical protein C5167_007955 [Papaver somniferum]